MWQPQLIPQRIERIQLIDDWYACDTAQGYVAYAIAAPPSAGYIVAGKNLENLYDPAGFINNCIIAQWSDGEWYIPAGMIVVCWQPQDCTDGHWELLNVGLGCSSSSGSTGSGSYSGSGSSASCNPNRLPTGGQPCWVNIKDCSGNATSSWYWGV